MNKEITITPEIKRYLERTGFSEEDFIKSVNSIKAVYDKKEKSDLEKLYEQTMKLEDLKDAILKNKNNIESLIVNPFWLELNTPKHHLTEKDKIGGPSTPEKLFNLPVKWDINIQSFKIQTINN